MLRSLALTIALMIPTWAHAQCTGTSFWNMLTPEQQSDLTEQSDATPFGTGNFWTVTKDDRLLTIVGTMHLPDPRQDAYFAHAKPRLDNADLLLVEATLEDQSAMQVYMARNAEIMTLNDGTALPDYLDDETWEILSQAAAARGLPSFVAAKMQPWFLALTLAIPACIMPQMASGEAGLDNMLLVAAGDMNIPVAPLEPWEDMFALLTSGTFEEQIEALRVTVIEPAVQDAMVVALIDFYFAGQSAKAWQMAYFTKDFIPEADWPLFDDQMAQLEQALLVDRNAAWIPVIEEAAMTHDEIFIGFGAAHLFGETGVLRLLEKNGWTVTPF